MGCAQPLGPSSGTESETITTGREEDLMVDLQVGKTGSYSHEAFAAVPTARLPESCLVPTLSQTQPSSLSCTLRTCHSFSSQSHLLQQLESLQPRVLYSWTSLGRMCSPPKLSSVQVTSSLPKRTFFLPLLPSRSFYLSSSPSGVQQLSSSFENLRPQDPRS